MNNESSPKLWKWKHFLPVWLAVFWLAPSYKVHNFMMASSPPPGSDLAPPPDWISFGAVHFLDEIFNQAAQFSIGDAFSVLFFHLLPFTAYTLLLATVIYMAIIAVMIITQGGKASPDFQAARQRIGYELTHWNRAKVGRALMAGGIGGFLLTVVTENLMFMMAGVVLAAAGVTVMFIVWYSKALRD